MKLVKMSWESWIEINDSDDRKPTNEWDLFSEDIVKRYNLRTKERYPHLKDLVHCFILWWDENKRKFKRYNSASAIASLLDIKHSNVLHYRERRKKSKGYELNVIDIQFDLVTFTNSKR